ncbi:MAG TPA: tetratricopeptide repeat protein [Candidatus Hydrogenedentes bacterium]|nr:tetratricopeptide repeat protein [Candidatus Hydrogenedentota bacterium]
MTQDEQNRPSDSSDAEPVNTGSSEQGPPNGTPPDAGPSARDMPPDNAPEEESVPSESVAKQEDLDRLVAALMEEGAAERDSAETDAAQETGEEVRAESDSGEMEPEAAASISGEPEQVPIKEMGASDGEEMVEGETQPPEAVLAAEPLAASPDKESLLDQSALEVLLSKAATDEAEPAEMDAPLVDAPEDENLAPVSEEDVLIIEEETEEKPLPPLTPTQIDKLMAKTSKKSSPSSRVKRPPTAAAPIPEETIETLISAMEDDANGASEREGKQEQEQERTVGTENIVAAATTPSPSVAEVDLLAKEELDAQLAQAMEEDRRKRAEKQREVEKALREAAKKRKPEAVEITEPPPAAISATDYAPPPKPHKPARVSAFLHDNILRITVSLTIGLLVALGAFTWLYVNQELIPPMDALGLRRAGELELAIRRAERFYSVGDYERAARELERPIARAAPGKERSDALFLQIDATYHDYFEYGGDPLRPTEIIDYIDRAIAEAPMHPRAPEAVYWKAKLYESDALPYAAMDAYRQLIEQYPDAPHSDKVLYEAAQLALELRHPRDTSEYAQRLVRQFPGSAYALAARLLLGDAYAMAGMEDDARTLYVRVAQAHLNDAIGAEAYLRLARLAMTQQRYDEVITHLESRMQDAFTEQGNDQVHLLLAQAYRMKGQRERAREILSDLINFFPESEVIPDAYVELTQVLDDLGQRKDAVRLAQQAARRYPDSPQVLRNAGELLGLEGNALAAASMLAAADEAGANDPTLLLIAARHYRALNMLEQARETYATLRRKYSRAPQAVTAGIEEAQVLYAMERVVQAISRMEDLMVTASGGDQRLGVLLAAATLYRDLGIAEKVVELSKQIAGLVTDPQMLAETAIDLIDAGATEDARRIISRVDFSRVKNATAYALFMKEGKALISVDPRRGLERMEQAYLGYPEARSPEDEQDLIEAYLAADRPAAVRRIVMEKRARAREAPVELPYFIDAAVTWADYLFAKGDYRAAADAYAMAQEAAADAQQTISGIRKDIGWAKYQRANALLELNDFHASLALFTEIAASDAPWAKEAAMKAEYARLEQQLRGETPIAQEG